MFETEQLHTPSDRPLEQVDQMTREHTESVLSTGQIGLPVVHCHVH